MRATQRLLAMLQDVGGVLGSFVVAPEGELLASAMPEDFALSQLELTASRIARILRCAASHGIPPQDGVFDFGEGKLWVREFLRGYLCVLCVPTADMRSLRLSSRLVARGLPAEL